MDRYDILEVILIAIWLTMLGLQVYQLGYESGEGAGRKLGCHCRREGQCPCEQREGE